MTNVDSNDPTVLRNVCKSCILEVKCPASGKEQGIAELFQKLSFLKIDENGPYLKSHHPYYGQIQLALWLSNLKQGVLILYSHKDDDVGIVDQFCKNVYNVLTKVYFEHVLPYLMKS